MDTIDILKDILANVNRRTKTRCPSIDELPPEGRDVNWNPSGEGSASAYAGKMVKRTRRRFRLGQSVRFFIPRDGVFEEGVIVFRRGSDRYQVRSFFDGKNHLKDGRNLRPL